MLSRSSHFGGASDSHKTFEFSARKSGVKKRARIRDEPGRGSHLTVDFWRSQKTLEITGKPQVQEQRRQLCLLPSPSARNGGSIILGVLGEPILP
jgi:hypothetical protein